MSTQATPMFTLTDSTSRPEISALNRAGPSKMQTHQKCPPRRITSLECTLTNNGPEGSLECPVTSSLDLKFPGIRASWTFGGAELLWRSSTSTTTLGCTDTKNAPATPLECTDTNSLNLKSFRFHSYKKRGVGGHISTVVPTTVILSGAKDPSGESRQTLHVTRIRGACLACPAARIEFQSGSLETSLLFLRISKEPAQVGPCWAPPTGFLRMAFRRRFKYASGNPSVGLQNHTGYWSDGSGLRGRR